jgi:hypothetical protein
MSAPQWYDRPLFGDYDPPAPSTFREQLNASRHSSTSAAATTTRRHRTVSSNGNPDAPS